MQFGGGRSRSRRNLRNCDQAHEILYHLGLEFFVKLECAMGIMITRQVHKPCCGLLWRSKNKFYSEITVFCPTFLHSHWSWGEAELCKSILGSIYAKQPGFRAFVARVWLIQSHLIRAGRGAQVLQLWIRMECFGGSGQTRNVHIQLMHLPTLANTLTKSSVHLLGIFW